MKAATKQHDWASFLNFYAEQNAGRATRLGVFENGNDFWIEDGLPLAGIAVETRGEMPTVEIMLGDELTHAINNARNFKITFSADGINDGLDITDAEGKTTVLRFENFEN
jgi:hypothetical protein